MTKPDKIIRPMSHDEPTDPAAPTPRLVIRDGRQWGHVDVGLDTQCGNVATFWSADHNLAASQANAALFIAAPETKRERDELLAVLVEVEKWFAKQSPYAFNHVPRVKIRTVIAGCKP